MDHQPADRSIDNILYPANGDQSNPKEYTEAYRAGRMAVINNYRSMKMVANEQIYTIRQTAQDKGNKREMIAWMDAVRSGKPEPVPFNESFPAMQASFAVIQSISQGRAVEI
jgi:predicted dehydrogenase